MAVIKAETCTKWRLAIKISVVNEDLCIFTLTDIRQNLPDDLNFQQLDCEDFTACISYLFGIFTHISDVYNLSPIRTSDNTLTTSGALNCEGTIGSSALYPSDLLFQSRTTSLLSVVLSPNTKTESLERQRTLATRSLPTNNWWLFVPPNFSVNV